MPNASPGQPWPLNLEFLNSETGVPADASSVQLDITYGGIVGYVPDAAGPFTYSGASSPTAGQIWRTSAGMYSFSWPVPGNALAGVYTANWQIGFQGDTYFAEENFYVQGAGRPPFPSADVGYWTGGLIYPAAGLDIEFGSGPDANGVSWIWNRIEGWDSPDVQGGGVIPKAGDHGAFPAPQYYAARQMTLTVTASAPTQALRDLARALLQQAVPVNDLVTLRYDEPVPKQAMVRRSGKVTEKYPTLADVEFTVGLVAPDPRKYSTQVKTVTVNAANLTGGGIVISSSLTLPFTLPPLPPGGSGAVTNAGTFESRPVITISGPITSPALTNVTTGQTVSWTGLTVPAGAQLVVDFSVAQALLSGVYRPADAFSSWWTLPANTTSTIALAGQGDAGASIQVAWSDCWM